MKTIHIIKLSIQAALLVTSLILCASAAALSMRSPPRAYRLSLNLAAIALAITMMGAWAPDPPFWPRMGFAWQFDNGWHIAFDFRWFFVQPLLLAARLVCWSLGGIEHLRVPLNYSTELTRARRSDQSAFVSPWRLARAVHPDRSEELQQ
jgi:hypothetical protein